MLQYALFMLRRQLGKSVLISGGFLMAACALILLSATTQTTILQANQLISQNWQPTYDLVVLPSTTKAPSEQNVPADFLQSSTGNISIQQYNQIKELPGIEVAAPIAYVGYVTLPSPTISFPGKNISTGYYQLNWTLTAFTGQRHLVEYQESAVYHISPCGQVYEMRSIDEVIKGNDTQSPGDCPPSDTQSTLSLITPDTGTFLLAAIDPTEESALVHLNTSITTGRMLNEQDTIHPDTRIPSNVKFINPKTRQPIPAEAIPLLIHQNLPAQVTLTAQFTELMQGTVHPEQLQKSGGTSYLVRQPNHKTIFSGTVPLVQNDPQRFANTQLQWDGHHWGILPSSKGDLFSSFGYALDFSSASAPVGLTYQSITAPNGEQAYSLVPTGVQGPEVTFRKLDPLHTIKKSHEDVVYTFESVGQFTDKAISAQFSNPLNWLPENTYVEPPIVSRYDSQGHSVTPKILLPTTNRAGYLMQPPLAITTLAAAQQLKGNNIISAIRIRVAKVEKADQDSWKRIQKVADLIRQRTHLSVLVTLGSSPKPTLVFVPGVKQGQFAATQDIPAVGWVEERWISIGASIIYLTQLGATRLLLIGAVLAVCLGYLAVAFSSFVTAQRTEFAILSALGWQPWQSTQIFLTQVMFLALGGGIVGLGIALLATAILGIIPIGIVVVYALPLILVMALLCSLYPLLLIWHTQPAEILRMGYSISSTRRISKGFIFWPLKASITGLVMRNLARSRSRTFLAIGTLFLSAILLVLMLSSILALRQTLKTTLLGNFILFQTAAPQISACVFAVLFTFLSVADLLLLQLRERWKEIGLLQAIGWRPELVRRLLVQEGLTLAMVGTLPGIFIALCILAVSHVIQDSILASIVALSTLILMMSASVLATLPTLYKVRRMQIVEALRSN